jgi:hypothetical protein
MSLRAIPLIAIAFFLYWMIVAASGEEGLAASIMEPTLLSGGVWKFTWGDLILLATLILLFVEVVKATYTSTSTMIDHGLSMVLFIICLVAFLMVPQASNSVFFLILAATLIDVVAGYTIGIRVARRDLSIGGGEN